MYKYFILAYRTILERKNEESESLVDKYKSSLANTEADRDAVVAQASAKDKLIGTLQKQYGTMKQLIDQYGIDNKNKEQEIESLMVKVNRLITINKDLIQAKEDHLRIEKTTVEKTVVEVNFKFH